MFQLSDERRALVRAVRDLAESEFESRACTWQGEFPRGNVELLADRGYLGINFPEEYAGGGLTELEALLVVETAGRVCQDTAEVRLFQQFVAPRAIDMFGSADCKEWYLPSHRRRDGRDGTERCRRRSHAGQGPERALITWGVRRPIGPIL